MLHVTSIIKPAWRIIKNGELLEDGVFKFGERIFIVC